MPKNGLYVAFIGKNGETLVGRFDAFVTLKRERYAFVEYEGKHIHIKTERLVVR